MHQKYHQRGHSKRCTRCQILEIMADETQDCSTQEQLVIAIRYIDTKNVPKSIKEEPVVILDLFSIDSS